MIGIHSPQSFSPILMRTSSSCLFSASVSVTSEDGSWSFGAASEAAAASPEVGMPPGGEEEAEQEENWHWWWWSWRVTETGST